MFLANKTSIDFIAHHEIQFQACRGVYEELSKVHECRNLIGQDSIPTGAEAAVLVDHGIFQPNVNRKNYRFLIHMSHDLADVDIYEEEKKLLYEFDLILVPGDLHYQKASRYLNAASIFKIGWPKLEVAGATSRSIKEIESGKINILYAPSFVNNREWVELLPELIESGHEILIKNHIYYDFDKGAQPPRGGEALYAQAVDSLLGMESYLAQLAPSNVEYIDRRVNLCSLFDRADVLITDSSSASLEFLSFGLSIETGRYGLKTEDSRPCSSLLTDLVRYIPLNDLIPLLKDRRELQIMLSDCRRKSANFNNPLIFIPPHGPSKHAASLIDLLFYLNQNRGVISFKKFGVFSWLQSLLNR